jgi:hypothetical protein
MSEQACNDDQRDTGPTELAAFQAALARLSPAPDGINLARLLFRAGQLSAPRRSWILPCATAASTILVVVLGSVLLIPPVRQPAERIVTVYVPVPSVPTHQLEVSTPSTNDSLALPSASISSAGDTDYLRLRSEVLTHGLDALPQPTMWSTAMPAVDTDSLLDMPRGSREPWLLRLKHSLHSGGPL